MLMRCMVGLIVPFDLCISPLFIPPFVFSRDPEHERGGGRPDDDAGLRGAGDPAERQGGL